MGPRARRTAALAAAVGIIGWPLLADGAVPGSCRGVAVTLSGTDGDDRLVGTPGPDVVAAGAGDDVVEGLGGDDLLCGDAGSDHLVGGEGDDVLDGGRDRRDVVDTEAYDWAGDTLEGGPGDDQLAAGPTSPEGPVDTVTYAGSATPVDLDLARGGGSGEGTATGEGTDVLVGPFGVVEGSPHDDVLRGTDGPEELRGLAGADRLEGRGGADTLVGLDQLGEALETDGNVLVGGAGADYLDGDAGPDVLLGGGGRDALRADGGPDRSAGGPGADDVDDTLAAAGDQVLDGGAGTDTLSPVLFARPGLAPGEVVRGVRGSTDLRAGRLRATHRDGRELVVAVTGFESVWTPFLHGGWVLLGTAGADDLLAVERPGVTLRGRGGDDVLSGSFRRDLLDGGRGQDTVFRSPGGDRLRSVERRR